MRHKPGISKHYSTMRNFYNLICLDTCETYESFVGDFFLLFFLWIDSALTFDLLPWSDETLSARLNFWWLNFADIGGDNQKKKTILNVLRAQIFVIVHGYTVLFRE